ncbi:DUF4381 domain-containing protein [Pseudomonas sp. FW300-N1A1]|uniref:DUF4381 domain-containing protein n=1 Tax=Pseudomonas sp. FW300-N1A1 TaxID=2075555 RepID=UPI000CD1A6BE|nr:DUF4381 domain-containing protein [Pseudomonas sp. FW300-N1A1]POA17779.1 DUF4381 domain-containing protein [Pseudomonas sp. FW300-N1A1]
MTAQIPSIDQLTELGLPAPVSYLPQTWGLWALLGLVLSGLLVWAARRYWQWRRDRYRREALVRLTELERSNDTLEALRELPELLKRVALSMPASASGDWHTSPVGAGALSGEDWQVFLVKHSPTALPADFSRQLATLAYAPDAVLHTLPVEQRQQLFSTCKHWVEHHHVAV